MLKIENVEIAGWKPAIRGMRNPKNSWDRSDSHWGCFEDNCDSCPDWRACMGSKAKFVVEENDYGLMMNLAKGGPVHAKYRRMIVVWLDITAPLYWWKEFDTYKVGTVANSCSTMHKIHDKRFEREDFSIEHLLNNEEQHWMVCMDNVISSLNVAREKYLETKSKPMKEEGKRSELMKKYWWQMIQLLPSSYNQKRTIKLNYEVLHHMYHDRRFHKLDEWHTFCDWVEALPYSEIMTQKVVGIE